MMDKVRALVQIEGIVQGVGFRPFVYDRARLHDLTGWVRNDEHGVCIEVEGEEARVTSFLSALATPPPLARVEKTHVDYRPPIGYQGFEIRASQASEERLALIAPDTATCVDCRRELFDPRDRRFRYPFINCTNCGPRFTIIADIPYDRAATTMAPFAMCPACSREYHDPTDRRFHAQPNACPTCGPQVRLLDAAGKAIATADPISETIRLLKAGRIVAIKGLGGFHLACDAAQEDAVSALRSRKYREDKPFALMCRDLAAIERLCVLDDAACALLQGRERPIVILPRRQGTGIAPSVAPGQGTLGVMLPYTPLHHLLLADGLASLVMTSGNRSDEPIAYRDAEAVEQLRGIADFFLVHNREIHTRCDDSVIKPFRGKATFLRRARGFCPAPLRLERRLPRRVQQEGNNVLACGAALKNTFCLTRGDHAFLSPHIGDLENYETMRSFEHGIALMKRLFQIEPAIVCHDLHPDYLSTRFALGYAEHTGRAVRTIGVQHHFAHALSCMAEHGLAGPVLAVVLDGTGYGADGTAWGGEFLQVTLTGFTRLGHLRHIPLPGGDAAAREPWRMAAAYLERACGTVDAIDAVPIPFAQLLDSAQWSLLRQAMQAGINAPLCSSMGRLFDAVSALLGVRGQNNYEGQAAIELEQMARPGELGEYPLAIAEQEGGLILDPDPVIAAITEEIMHGEAPAVISARFHNAVARAIARMAVRMREAIGLADVVLSGGVFQNHLLLNRTCDFLTGAGFTVYCHHQVPANDGGIALGQALRAIHLPDREG
jgi:hydrogenase maturation protein HypF